MSAAADAMFPLEQRPERYARAAALAFAVHALLVAVLFLGVRWQSHPPEVVQVELVDAPRPAPVEAPRPPPPPPPAPEVAKPEPKVEKPEIVEKPVPKPKPEPKKAEPPKPEPKKPEPKKPEPKKAEPRKPEPKVDTELQKRVQEQLAREQQAFRDQQVKEQIARDQAGARSKAIATWVDKIRLKIRGNIVLPPDVPPNVEAIFDVTQLPTGDVIDVKLRKSSGHKGYDTAVENAILKSTPLPKPDQPSLFERRLELRFRPVDR